MNFNRNMTKFSLTLMFPNQISHIYSNFFNLDIALGDFNSQIDSIVISSLCDFYSHGYSFQIDTNSASRFKAFGIQFQNPFIKSQADIVISSLLPLKVLFSFKIFRRSPLISDLQFINLTISFSTTFNFYVNALMFSKMSENLSSLFPKLNFQDLKSRISIAFDLYQKISEEEIPALNHAILKIFQIFQGYEISYQYHEIEYFKIICDAFSFKWADYLCGVEPIRRAILVCGMSKPGEYCHLANIFYSTCSSF